MSEPSRLVWIVAVLFGGLGGGCTVENDKPDPFGMGAETTGPAAQGTAGEDASGGLTDGETDGDEGDGSSSTGGGGPAYPSPEPVALEGSCPAGTLGPISFDLNGWVCLPPCEEGDPPTCPVPDTGTATASCSTNPMSSASPCDSGSDCVLPGELCGNIGAGQRGCLLPPSHCLLRCQDGASCPDGMSCSADAICQYTP